jgi:hypothetical protein
MRAIAVVLSAALSLGACAYSPDTVTRSTVYNTAVAQATNQIILRNIIRASERQPRYFTRLGSNSASTTLSPGVSLSIPFAEITHSSLSASTQSSSQNVLTIDNMDDQGYWNGALKQVSPASIGYFLDQGIQPELVGLLFFNTIQVPAAELPVLKETLAKTCAVHDTQFCRGDASLIAAQGLTGRFSADECWNPSRIAIIHRQQTDYALYINDPAIEDLGAAKHPALCFQIVLRALLALGLHPQGKDGMALDADVSLRIAQHPAFRANVLHCDKPKCGATAANSLDDLHIQMSIRSFEGVIYYLGDVVRSQGGIEATGSSARPYFLAVLGRQPWGEPGSLYEERLFSLERGPANSEPEISVTDDNGQAYWVPRNCLADSAPRDAALSAARNCSIEYPDHESLTVLALINQLWGLQKAPSAAGEPVRTISIGG